MPSDAYEAREKYPRHDSPRNTLLLKPQDILIGNAYYATSTCNGGKQELIHASLLLVAKINLDRALELISSAE